MSLEQSVDRLSTLIEQLIAQLEAGRTAGATANTPAPTPEKKYLKGGAQSSGSKSEPVASPVPESAPPSDTGASVTYDQVKAATNALAKVKGVPAVLAVLQTYGVDHATKLVEGQWAAYVSACRVAQEA